MECLGGVPPYEGGQENKLGEGKLGDTPPSKNVGWGMHDLIRDRMISIRKGGEQRDHLKEGGRPTRTNRKNWLRQQRMKTKKGGVPLLKI